MWLVVGYIFEDFRLCGIVRADKRKVVKTLLKDEEWSQWSDREIARQCKVSTPTVAKDRKSICKSFTDKPKKVKRGNQEYTVNTSNIGNSSAKSDIHNPVKGNSFD